MDGFDMFDFDTPEPSCVCGSDASGVHCSACGEDICDSCAEFFGGRCTYCAEAEAEVAI